MAPRPVARADPQRFEAVVIGAGMTGLAAADALNAAGHSVCVFEAADGPGGLVRSTLVEGEPVEAYYHHAFPIDRELLALVDRLGLRDRFEWRPASTAVLAGESIYPFNTVPDLLRYGPIPLWARLRLGLGGLFSILPRRSGALDRASVGQLGPRWFGRRGYEVLWQPLLDGKFGPYSPDVAMTWLVARIRQRTSSRRGGRGDKLGYMRGGFGTVAEAYAAELRRRGVSVRFATPVTGVERAGEGLRVTAGGGSVAADAVLACLPWGALEKLADPPEGYRRASAAIPYRGVVCLLLELDRPLGSHYWTNLIRRSRLSCLAVIEHTNFIPAERYGNRHLVYLTHYVEPDGPVWNAGPDDLLAALEDQLRVINPSWDRGWILRRQVFRDRWAQPVPLAGGPMPDLPTATGIPGLFHASLAHVYPEDRGMSAALRVGGRVGTLAHEWLADTTASRQGRQS